MSQNIMTTHRRSDYLVRTAQVRVGDILEGKSSCEIIMVRRLDQSVSKTARLTWCSWSAVVNSYWNEWDGLGCGVLLKNPAIPVYFHLTPATSQALQQARYTLQITRAPQRQRPLQPLHPLFGNDPGMTTGSSYCPVLQIPQISVWFSTSEMNKESDLPRLHLTTRRT